MNWEQIMVFNRKLNDVEHDYINTKKENTNLKQALIDIREYCKSQEYVFEDDDYIGRDCECDGYKILQIIDKVLGDEK